MRGLTAEFAEDAEKDDLNHEGTKDTKAMKSTKEESKLVATEVVELLRKKYPHPKWASAIEVGDKTGFGQGRRCDFIAMHTWPSSGLHLHGHEIKVSRSDWLKEIQEPDKAWTFQRRCHYWWVVAPKGVVKIEELPEGWGYLLASKSSTRVKRPATIRESPDIDHEFLASLLRSMQGQSDVEGALKAAESSGWKRGQKYAEEQFRRHGNTDLHVAERLAATYKRRIDEFEKASGIKLLDYD